jgi:hypothetical protein
MFFHWRKVNGTLQVGPRLGKRTGTVGEQTRPFELVDGTGGIDGQL